MRIIRGLSIALVSIGLTLLVATGAEYARRAVAGMPSQAVVAAHESDNREKHSMATSAFDLCMAIGRPFGCEDFRFADDAGDKGFAIISGRRASITIYPSNDAMLDALADSHGMNSRGQKLTIIAGGNWLLAYRPSDDDPEHAMRLAIRMGGQWVNPDEIWKD